MKIRENSGGARSRDFVQPTIKIARVNFPYHLCCLRIKFGPLLQYFVINCKSHRGYPLHMQGLLHSSTTLYPASTQLHHSLPHRCRNFMKNIYCGLYIIIPSTHFSSRLPFTFMGGAWKETTLFFTQTVDVYATFSCNRILCKIIK